MNDIVRAAGLKIAGKVASVWLLLLTAMFVPMAIAGCSPLGLTYGKPVEIAADFNPRDAAFIRVKGKADIRGQAFVPQTNGRLMRASGTDVYLIPRTAYADERMKAIFGDKKYRLKGRPVPDPDPSYEAYMRKTIASSGGSFAFENVADGEYYVVAGIRFPNDLMYLEFPVMERVTVANGRNVRLVIRGY